MSRVRRIVGTLLIGCSLAGATSAALAADAGRLRWLAAIYVDGKGVGMREPEAVACNDRSTLIVGDTGRGRLLRYTVEDRDVKPAGEFQAPQVSAPIRVQLTSKNEVLALDGRERRIGRFGARGEFKGYLAAEGLPAPTTLVPRSFKVDQADRVYLLDVFSARVVVLDLDGKYQSHLPFPKDYGFFSDVAVDARGGVYLLDSVGARLHAAPKGAQQFTPLGASLRAHVSFPTSLVADSRGVLYVVDQQGGGIVLVGQDGSVLGRQLAMGVNEGALAYPSQICVTTKGQVFVADRGNSRVQLFFLAR
jgi:sugar lactone lactonase YvrE